MARIYTIHDRFKKTSLLQLRLDCVARGLNNAFAIKMFIPKEFEFSAKSNWERFLGDLTNNAYFDILDAGLQLTSGVTINQPFLQQQSYKGTDPLKLKFDSVLVSEGDAKKDVWETSLNLLSLLLPIRISTKYALSAWRIPGPAIDADEIISTIKALGEEYLNYSAENKEAAGGAVRDAPVTVTIGGLLQIDNCFIPSMSIKYSTVLEEGYPIMAKVSFEISTQDAMTTNTLRTVDISLDSIASLLGAS